MVAWHLVSRRMMLDAAFAEISTRRVDRFVESVTLVIVDADEGGRLRDDTGCV